MSIVETYKMDTRANNGKILGIYNNFHSNPVFKKVSDDRVMLNELMDRKYLSLYATLFKVETLTACKIPFMEYIAKHGKQQPVHTSYMTVNYYLNKACYYSYNYFRTNQPYANRVKEIIERTEAKIKDNEEHRIDVFSALMEIKKVYDDMVADKVLTGEVMTNINNLFKKFYLRLENNELRLVCKYEKENINQSMQNIEAVLAQYPIEFTKGRIRSSYD